ncbi:MAG: C4-type zinc ribbon domain-containing protein [Caldilineales bacterium]|nr:C4-type zinc ribbon domain-containing protein [Caldilineales bacterium]
MTRLIEQLAALQTLDSQLDADRRRYAAIQEALHEPESLRQAQAALDEATARLERWQRERRRRETAVADQQARIRDQEKQLYGGRIKDMREQVALQQNVEMLKRQLGRLEEEALEAILEVEQAERDVAQARAHLEAEQAAWQQTQAQLLAEREALIVHARQLKNRRQSLSAQLSPDLVQRYEALRQKGDGLAVARVHHGVCGGCGASLPTAVQQQARGDTLVTCPFCRRLLCG